MYWNNYNRATRKNILVQKPTQLTGEAQKNEEESLKKLDVLNRVIMNQLMTIRAINSDLWLGEEKLITRPLYIFLNKSLLLATRSKA